MAQSRANQQGADLYAHVQYLESYQRLVTSWIEAIVERQGEAKLAKFNSSNQQKPGQQAPARETAVDNTLG